VDRTSEKSSEVQISSASWFAALVCWEDGSRKVSGLFDKWIGRKRNVDGGVLADRFLNENDLSFTAWVVFAKGAVMEETLAVNV
jgi:hypothetical protein